MKQISQQQIGRIYRQSPFPKEIRHLFLVIAALLAGILGAVSIGWYQFLVTVVLLVGIVNVLLSLTNFALAKILERYFKQPDSLRGAVRRIDQHSLRFLAWFIGHNIASAAAQRWATRYILRSIEDVNQRSLRRTDRTLVETRLLGVDGTPGIGSSVHPGLAHHFDNIIEVNRHGQTLAVYPGTRRP